MGEAFDLAKIVLGLGGPIPVDCAHLDLHEAGGGTGPDESISGEVHSLGKGRVVLVDPSRKLRRMRRVRAKVAVTRQA